MNHRAKNDKLDFINIKKHLLFEINHLYNEKICQNLKQIQHTQLAKHDPEIHKELLKLNNTINIPVV